MPTALFLNVPFQSFLQPFAFHQVMRSLLIPLSLTTNARGLTLETYLDPTIDTVSQKCREQVLRGGHQIKFFTIGC